jgi:hypothetical protein
MDHSSSFLQSSSSTAAENGGSGDSSVKIDYFDLDEIPIPSPQDLAETADNESWRRAQSALKTMGYQPPPHQQQSPAGAGLMVGVY